MLIALTSGCATGRLADLRDCGSISAGFGVGLGAEARIGALSQLSVGLISQTAQYGYENRYESGKWYETSFYWPFSFYTGFLDEVTDEKVSSIFTTYTRVCENKKIINPPPYRSGRWLNFKNLDHPKSSLIKHATDFEVGATVIALSFRVGINPLEIVDFLLGFVGLDIAMDDKTSQQSGAAYPPQGVGSADP